MGLSRLISCDVDETVNSCIGIVCSRSAPGDSEPEKYYACYYACIQSHPGGTLVNH